MLNKLKRQRLAWAVSSLIVVAMLCSVLALLAYHLRAQIIARLTHQITYGTDPESAVAVRRLGSLPYPPLEVLATSAASFRRPVAQEAQQVISDLMRRWQQQLNAGRHKEHVALCVTGLTDALTQNRDNFLRRDYRWIGRTARKLHRLSEQLAAEIPPAVTDQCEAMLAWSDPNLEPELKKAATMPRLAERPGDTQVR